MKIKIATALFTALLLAPAAVAHNAPSESLAPFQFNWGASMNDVKKAIGKSHYVTPRGKDNILILNNIDSKNFLYRKAALYFTKDGLQYAHIKGKEFNNDLDGKKGFTFYRSEKKRLLDRYSHLDTRSFEFVDIRNTYERDTFYKCLNYLDCGKFKTYFSYQDKPRILLSLEAKSEDTGYLMYTFQGDKWAN
nr:hypothetical protein [Vibrio splendidus]MCC4880429.1 hypothetical protein [Vibrio splendidus]